MRQPAVVGNLEEPELVTELSPQDARIARLLLEPTLELGPAGDPPARVIVLRHRVHRLTVAVYGGHGDGDVGYAVHTFFGDRRILV